MIAWSDSVVPSWVRVEDVSDTDHPTAVKIVLPAGAITARSTRHLGSVYTGQPCGIEIVCCDIDDANRIMRNLNAQLDTIRWNRRRDARAATVRAGLDEAEADRATCDELAQLPITHPDHGGFEQ
jgi:hypothetical protein